MSPDEVKKMPTHIRSIFHCHWEVTWRVTSCLPMYKQFRILVNASRCKTRLIKLRYLEGAGHRALSKGPAYLGTWVCVGAAARLQGFSHLCQRQSALVNCFPSLTLSKKRSSAVQSQ